MNNIALFVTHNIFLTEDEASRVADGHTVSTTGHCVPVWIDAKTGNTTEPAKEVFCQYVVHNSPETEREVRVMPKKGYEIFIPKCSGWEPPEKLDQEKISVWPSEERMALFKQMEKWWFSNPRPMDAENLRRGYIRFETKKTETGRRARHEQHVVEIAFWNRLINSLAT